MLLQRELFEILRGFASLQPVHSLKWPTRLSIQATHDFLLHSILLDSYFQSYPPSIQYQKQFWKWAINELERQVADLSVEDCDEFEIDSRIYDHYLEILPPGGPTIGSFDAVNRSRVCARGLPVSHCPPSQSFVTYYWTFSPGEYSNEESNGESFDLSRCQPITLLESQRMIESGTTGLRTWLASFALAQYLTLHPDIVANRRVLELGCGVGFLGIVVRALQARRLSNTGDPVLYLTDANDEVLVRCNKNLQLGHNPFSSNTNIHICRLDWSSSLDATKKCALHSFIRNDIRADIILGADIVFDPSLIPSLVGTLKIALSDTQDAADCCSELALIALTVRNEDTVGIFISEIKGAGLSFKEVSLSHKERLSTTINVFSGMENIKLFQITRL